MIQSLGLQKATRKSGQICPSLLHRNCLVLYRQHIPGMLHHCRRFCMGSKTCTAFHEALRCNLSWVPAELIYQHLLAQAFQVSCNSSGLADCSQNVMDALTCLQRTNMLLAFHADMFSTQSDNDCSVLSNLCRLSLGSSQGTQQHSRMHNNAVTLSQACLGHSEL